jgi:hypothetical protein
MLIENEIDGKEKVREPKRNTFTIIDVVVQQPKLPNKHLFFASIHACWLH